MKTIPLDEAAARIQRLPLKLPISMGGEVHSGPSLQIGVTGTEVFILPVPEAGFTEEQARLLARHVAHATNVLPELEDALLNALPYVEDVLNNPEQLACFKPGVVQKHADQIRTALAKATTVPV